MFNSERPKLHIQTKDADNLNTFWVVYFLWKKVQPRPWQQTCEWSTSVTSSASSWSSGSAHALSTACEWHESSWASGQEACTSCPAQIMEKNKLKCFESCYKLCHQNSSVQHPEKISSNNTANTDKWKVLVGCHCRFVSCDWLHSGQPLSRPRGQVHLFSKELFTLYPQETGAVLGDALA